MKTMRASQSITGELVGHPIHPEGAWAATVQSAEINRLLTAAVVNRRFCRLLLTNPLMALSVGYRGEAFHLNPTEVSHVSAIRATSLRDFALQLLMNGEAEDGRDAVYTNEHQEAALFAL